ncbi:MAG: acetate/propionate family kinase, partial [Planctomycetota bacterium]
MLILVANLGSTSFKYRLLDMRDETTLAIGSVDRIGSVDENEPASRCVSKIGDVEHIHEQRVADHGVAVQACLAQLTDPDNGVIDTPSAVSAIGFKAVHGGRLSGVFVIDDDVLDAMQEMSAAAPAHNPPYIAAIKGLRKRVGDIPLVAAFETDFHRTIPVARQTYAIPKSWTRELHIRRWGFHGASHRYIAQRTARLVNNPSARIVSCHLGGSSSLCAIRDGNSVATTMGMTPQTGLPQNNRVGDFDPFALPLIMRHTGEDITKTLERLANEGGLLGISGRSSDIRDIESAAADGDADCQLALDVYVEEVRRHLGGMIDATQRDDH